MRRPVHRMNKAQRHLAANLHIEVVMREFSKRSAIGWSVDRCPVQNLGTASLPNLNRMRHQGFHKSINFLLFVTENRQFHNFIIITMILPFPHDSAIRWEEVLGVLLGGSLAR